MNRRSLARSLARHAVAVTPEERRPWALGMAAELGHIDDDGAALSFALGAVWTSYRQGALVWSNWLRLGRCGVALWTAMLGLGLFYMSGWLQRLPAIYQTSVPFSGLMLLLGCGYLGAGWSLAKRRLRLFAGLVAGMSAMLTAAALMFAASPGTASPYAFYAALLRQEPAPPHTFYAALLLEESVFIALLAAAGAFFWRAERRAPAGTPA